MHELMIIRESNEGKKKSKVQANRPSLYQGQSQSISNAPRQLELETPDIGPGVGNKECKLLTTTLFSNLLI
jgi:hypothetical protein